MRVTIDKKGVLVHHGSEVVSIDAADLINGARERRDRKIVAEEPSE